jgi:acyl-CoA thioesterase-1
MEMRVLQALTRVALGGVLVWCTQSQGAPPEKDRAPLGAAAAPGEPQHASRDPRAPAPNPLVSRFRRVAGWSALPFANPRNVDDGDYSTSWDAGRPTLERPAWVSIEVGTGPRRLLLNWSAAGSFNYEETDYGSPGAYRIESSGDSTDGANGTWRIAVDAPIVSTHGHAHSFDFAGQRWVKFVVTRAPVLSPNGVQISEIDVHDATAGATDSWFFLGDSITAFDFDRAPPHQPSFAAWVHEHHPDYFPAMVNGGTGGDKSDEGATHIADWLARNPDAHFWAIAYGMNDAAGNANDTARFRANMQVIVRRVSEAGAVAILASIPFASDDQHRSIPKFNRVLDELRATNSLPAGPDLYTWFATHPEELRDGVHPNDRGIVSTNRLWGEAVDVLYPRLSRQDSAPPASRPSYEAP